MECSILGCEEETNDDSQHLVIVDSEDFMAKPYRVCDFCHKRITEATEPQCVQVSETAKPMKLTKNGRIIRNKDQTQEMDLPYPPDSD